MFQFEEKLNDYLKESMDDLFAKVFRINALIRTKKSQRNWCKNKPLEKKIEFYNDCNRKVAIVCNY